MYCLLCFVNTENIVEKRRDFMRKRILFVALVAVVLTACGSLKQSTESNNNVDNQTIGEAASTEETTKLEHLNTEDNLKEDIKDITNYEITEIRIDDDSGVYSITDKEIIDEFKSKMVLIEPEYDDLERPEGIVGGWSNIYFVNDTNVLYKLYVLQYGDGEYVEFNGKACNNKEFIKMAEEIEKVKGEKKKAGGTIIGETTKN